jgi:hypothetical protein
MATYFLDKQLCRHQGSCMRRMPDIIKLYLVHVNDKIYLLLRSCLGGGNWLPSTDKRISSQPEPWASRDRYHAHAVTDRHSQ